MELLSSFTHVFLNYAGELWFILAVGFFLSGLFYQFVPQDYVKNI